MAASTYKTKSKSEITKQKSQLKASEENLKDGGKNYLIKEEKESTFNGKKEEVT